MAEATQRYAPVQSQSVAPAVGAAPGMPQDTMFESVYNYAQKQNVTNLQTAREEEYVEGQLLAAQNNGVQEVRESQPWVSQIFGGGAALSGAMDYMEQTKLLEYQEDINNNMDEYRRMRPEDFKTQQMEKIKQFYTDDDETNQHIMRTFGMALPQIVKGQTKAHEGFVQEKHLEAMTTFVNLSLKNMETVRDSMDDDDVMSAEGALEDSLVRPAGMNKDAYKEFLYGQLQAAANTGDTALVAKIADMGLIQTPADVDLLEKADVTLQKYKANKERFQYATETIEVEHAAIDLVNVSDDQYTMRIKMLSDKYPMSVPEIKHLMRLRTSANNEALKAVDTQQYVDLFASGNANNIPYKDRQDVFAIAWEQGKKDPEQRVCFWKNLGVVGDKAKVVTESLRAGLTNPMTTDKDGNIVISEPAKTTIQNMKVARDATRDNGTPGVFTKHLDLYTRELFNAYETAEQGMPGAGEAAYMQAALDAMESHKDAATGASITIGTERKAAVIEAMDGMGNFDEDVFTDQKYMQTAMDSILHNMDIRLDDQTLAGRVEHALLEKYEVNDDGIWSAKINGKTVQERSGIEEPWKRLKEYSNLNLTVLNNDGRPVSVVGIDTSYSLDGSRDQFIVRDNRTHMPIAIIPFDELREWETPKKKPVITPSNQAAYNITVRKSRRRLARSMEDKVRSGEIPRTGPSTSLFTDDEYANRLVDSMTDEEVLTQHQAIVDTEGEDTGVIAKLFDFYDEAVGTIGNAVDDWMVSTGDVAIANMYEAYGVQQKQMEKKQRDLAQDYIEAITQEEQTVAELAGKVFHGQSAVAKVEELEGQLTPEEKATVEYEGYSTKDYSDSKGLSTGGVGQTGEYKNKPFKEVFEIKAEETNKAVRNFKTLPTYLRAELLAANYRGDLRGTAWLKAFNRGEYVEAAQKLFEHDELQGYLAEQAMGKPEAGGNIPERFANLRDAIITYSTTG